MSEMMKVEADEPGGISLETPIPAASTSDLEETQDSKDLIRQMLVIKVVPHDWSPRSDQHPPHIKEEEEELWIGKEEEQFTVKSEDEEKSKEEEKPLLSELYHIKTEDSRETKAPISSSVEQMETKPDGRDGGGAEPVSNQVLVCPVQQSKMTLHRDPPSKISSKPAAQLGVQGGTKIDDCKPCGKIIQNKTNDEFNMTTYTAKGDHSCPICGKEFIVKRYLQTHMRLHTSVRPFACEVCSKRFHRKTNLKIHMMAHSGEKPFSCDVCGKRFKVNESLKNHMKMHSTERPFVCSICSKDF